MNISECVKKLRESRGLTQLKFAALAEISPQTLQLVEQGGRATNRTRRRIAWALGVSITELGGLGATKEKTDAEVKEEGDFRAKMDALFEELIESDEIGHEDAIILSEKDNWLGFLEVLWLMKKCGAKLPKGIL